MDKERKQLSKGVRESFDSVGEIETDEITRLKTSLKVAEEAWAKARAAFDKPRFLIEGLAKQIAETEEEIKAVDIARPSVIAAALAGDDNFEADDELLQRRAALVLRLERLKLGGPALRPFMKAAEQEQAATASEVVALRERIESLSKQLRMAEAKRRNA